jgi:menaquinone-dependent protoporphyrinogen oxidase
VADVLVLYATRHGSTAEIAQRIAEVIRSHGHQVMLVDVRQLARVGDVTRFDAACIGAAVYSFRNYPRAIVRFVRRNRDWLAQVPSAFFSVGLVHAGSTPGGRDETQVTLDRFVTSTGWQPAHVEFIAGALRYSRYSLMTRRAMRRAAVRYGGDTDTSRDYTYTDWEQVEQFAHKLSARFDRERADS